MDSKTIQFETVQFERAPIPLRERTHSKGVSIKDLQRTPTASSQAIIAYRTLSISVSENRAENIKDKKKKKNNLEEGNDQNSNDKTF